MVHHISKQTCVVTAVYYNLKCGVNQRPIFLLFGVSGNIFLRIHICTEHCGKH